MRSSWFDPSYIAYGGAICTAKTGTIVLNPLVYLSTKELKLSFEECRKDQCGRFGLVARRHSGLERELFWIFGPYALVRQLSVNVTGWLDIVLGTFVIVFQ